MATFEVHKVEGELALHAAYLLMRELRPHLTDAENFIARVYRQAEQGYCLLGIWQDQALLALTGYRHSENLLYGRFLYVDDLVTAPRARSHGLGAKLIDALREEARCQNCTHLVLDTALGNALGQRFYYRQGLLAAGMHFRQSLA
ncbi:MULTISPECIES: GNAT family N-acetyltransferase [unclassified Symbiopectobacterium]|uniref:GNAT family N-acetyltransferase n=1 Tax=unclassified Symbiopectobacterium TaxID=2794573 RepID=UPI0022272FC7|nr:MULTISPECIES: GNAT family N-acetyltransferase [unclassified Symbiopectobacterium]MCW2473928.1 GNAT family N-acetyltransferase [Candidatus Symbiopectobacterium sp. NZEC151]MCW2482398.1 GNAT family N-acetyltransferase [Candidatus Symbiopectobacterium sp. NZEC135]